MGFEPEASMDALAATGWDPTGAVEILCDKRKGTNVLAVKVLESSTIQNYLSDPEVFMSK